jgi:hypothetical protein
VPLLQSIVRKPASPHDDAASDFHRRSGGMTTTNRREVDDERIHTLAKSKRNTGIGMAEGFQGRLD